MNFYILAFLLHPIAIGFTSIAIGLPVTQSSPLPDSQPERKRDKTGTANIVFKSTDSGKTWKLLPAGGLGGKMVGSNGVLLTTGARGIMRSTDDGENWYWVIREGGVGIEVAQINGGFAAITYSLASNTRRVRTSYDGGKTWQPIDAGLPAQLSIASIIEVGENFFCGHPKGIYRSTDKGKTWKLLLRSIEGKVFNLSVSGNVIYAIPRDGGC